MKKFSILSIMLMLIIISVSPAVAQDRTVVTWFVGLGSGTSEQQIEAQNQVVEDFNASQDEIELVINIGASFETSRDTFSTLLAAGNPPDIVGPVGVGGSNAFADVWADLTPYIEATDYDLSAYDPALVDLYRSGDELLGIPFAVFPSVTYYNIDLFDEAGANYPPSEFGESYIMPDGTEREWNYDTLRDLAMFMTVDANGFDATMEEFDPGNVVQFGLNFQWALMRLVWTDLQPENFYDAEANEITIPESWRTATEWLQAGIWEDSFIPNTTYQNSELFGNGNNFQSGNVAMSIVPLWYTCCLGESVGNFEWDLAVVPRSLDGEYHVATDADTFRMVEGSANPDAAFTVLSYLLDEAVPVLAPTYGAYPAREEYQESFEESVNERYPWGLNFDVPAASLAYNNPGEQHHEAFFPNWQQGTDRLGSFYTLLQGETGAGIDVQAELDTLESDLNDIISN
ncbi:MAG: ABC transporter substrate-binding protein [Anaerolineae bacterium]